MIYIYKNEILELTIRSREGYIYHIGFGQTGTDEKLVNWHSDHIKQEFDEYFMGIRKSFELAVSITASFFQASVLEKVKRVKYGETASYSDIACAIGKPSAVRAVASTIAKNPLPIIIPCHRIIKKNGEVGNYSGGTSLKNYLLEMEKQNK